ncbi:oligosaccharyl transferase subunit ost3/OST6 [Linnemannia schmuckeri]|uniref:Oligosaccharyl transferase subunit ost3/OST6 n=1 Tax=Linnemannia schmuckeri TaxID=64567 RepID=A0A9P5RR47_9FUNG|nr:oligosaccharyl transferase subunit ost3/OST6 [Linnemannia schmuckeri]
MAVISRTLFLTLLLALVAFLSASSSTSSFIAHAQPQNDNDALLQKKVSRLEAKASKNKGVIQLDSLAFEDVMAKPRNYSMVVLFTAISPEFNCVPCLNFDPEYKMVAAGWSKLANKSQLFFSILDFKAGQAIFQKFGMNSAPSVLYFPASSSISGNPSQDRYDFGKSGFQAESFAAWLHARSGVKIKVQRPFDFMGLAVKVLGTFTAVFAVIVFARKGHKIFASKYFWSTISMIIIFVMISGHMWNQIRNPPYSMPTQQGRSGFIANGFQNQFGLETQIIAVLYSLLTGASIGLIAVVPRIESPVGQRAAVWVCMGMFTFVFSILIQVFKMKNPGYPFTLMFR